MNEEDPEFEKTLRAINHYYITQVGICTAALSKLRSAELSDKNIIIRAIMCDMPDCGVETEASADDCGVDLWADRAEYVNETSFNLYVTQAEENVLWNAGEKGRKPGRLAVPQQRITVRSDGMGTAPVIPLIYLTLLSAKLLAMAFPDGCTDAELSGYNDERTMAALTDRVMTTGAAGPAGRGGGDPKPGKLSGDGQGRVRSRRRGNGPGRNAGQGRRAGTQSRDAKRAAGKQAPGPRMQTGGAQEGGRRRTTEAGSKAGGESGRRSRRNTAEEMKSGVHDRFEPHFSYICIL